MKKHLSRGPLRYHVVWFLLRRNLDLLSVCFSYIISKNHSNTFLLINLKKIKKLSQVKHCSQGHLFWCWDFDRFWKSFVYYLMSFLMYANKQVVAFIKWFLGNSLLLPKCISWCALKKYFTVYPCLVVNRTQLFVAIHDSCVNCRDMFVI